MCRPSVCSVCNKGAWVGCGLHVPTLMEQIPKEEWCTCKGSDNEYPPQAGTGTASQ